MKTGRHIVIWTAAALVATLVLLATLRTSHRVTQRRWAVQVTPRPESGARVFRDKGCAACHDHHEGNPQLQINAAHAGLPHLVTAMWNHAPQMWQVIQQQGRPFPRLSYDESGQLIAYLYFASFVDDAGNAERGRELFVQKRCAKCHSEGAAGAPGPAAMMAETDPLDWTQALWNHASKMQARMQQVGVQWPVLDASDLRDLFAFCLQSAGKQPARGDVIGDPTRGWSAFQQKRCVSCHSVNGERGSAPAFGNGRQLPPSYSQFGEALLNHFPRMEAALRKDGSAPPEFSGSDLSDITAFLYSLNYTEPAGSPPVGASLFAWRGCSRCHGENAQGTDLGPALRGRGNTYTASRLAADLWRHGASMYQQTRVTGQPWPVLLDSDIGNLLAFLNTPVESGD